MRPHRRYAAITTVVLCTVLVVKYKLLYKSSDAVSFSDTEGWSTSLLEHASRSWGPLNGVAEHQWSQCLDAFQSSRHRAARVEFLGHSRARQLFETLTDRLAARYLTRGQTQNHSFLDRPLEPAWRHYRSSNSTCLGIWPKPRSIGPVQAWCSHAAASQHLQLRFRWRNALHQLEDALVRIEAACISSSWCPDLLVFTQGLHIIATIPFHHSMNLYREILAIITPRLRRLVDRGVRVLWLPEIPGNPRAGVAAHNDDTLVADALAAELLTRQLQLPMWTAAVGSTTRLWTDVCYGRMQRVISDEERHVCTYETFHVDNKTKRQMVGQLLHALCPNTRQVETPNPRNDMDL